MEDNVSKNTVIYADGGTGKADSAVHLLNVNSLVKNCEETASDVKTKNQNAKDEFLKCQQCGEWEETFAAITYSHGTRVCRKCKKNNVTSDKAAYDRYINTKHSSCSDENDN
jgi:hypothetical protein